MQKQEAFFTVKSEQDEFTGIVGVEIQKDIGDGKHIVLEKIFNNSELALRWINYEKVNYFTIRFDRWFAHLKVLHQVGNPEYYTSPTRDGALMRLKYFQSEIILHPAIDKLAQLIIKIELDMLMVLPAHSNPSYKSSFKTFQGFILFANSHLPKFSLSTTL
ncbi:MAG: hypothetical protein WCO63_15245 [Bacteroidota bacterium]